MDKKERKRELISYFCSIEGVEFPQNFIFELNGWESLIAYSPAGWFYQMSYKSPTTWSLTKFPYDIYGKRIWSDVSGSWEDNK